jgi:hypothetical protein
MGKHSGTRGREAVEPCSQSRRNRPKLMEMLNRLNDQPIVKALKN